MFKKIFNYIKKDFFFYLTAVILAFLLFRNPYSTRTLIPNFEPFPDSFHYLSPARCFVGGEGFHMCLEGLKGTNQSVPPLYSIAMIPFFLITSDPRAVYFLNVLLSFISLYLLYKIIQKVTKHQLIIGFALFIYVTTYFTYWFPTLAMAENLLLPIFLGAVYLLSLKPTNPRIILAGFIAAGMHGSKYAALGLTIGYTILYGLHLWLSSKKNKQRWSRLILFLIVAVGVYFLLGGWKSVENVIGFLTPIFYQAGVTKNVIANNQAHSWFASPVHMADNLQFYFNSFILGKPLKILWNNRVLLPKLISLMALIGLAFGAAQKKYRWLSLSLIWLVVAQIIPVLPFYVADGRYAITLFPTLIIGFALALNLIWEKLPKKKPAQYFFTIFLIIAGGFYLINNVQQLRLQLALNLRYAETPWWYLGTQEMNGYFANNKFEKTPYLITLTSPFYLDYFGNNQYKSLPLSESQDFRSNSDDIWGIEVDIPLMEIYQAKVEAGSSVFVTNYGVSAANHFKQSYKEIENNFALTKMHSGCYNLCNIYKLSLL